MTVGVWREVLFVISSRANCGMTNGSSKDQVYLKIPLGDGIEDSFRHLQRGLKELQEEGKGQTIMEVKGETYRGA